MNTEYDDRLTDARYKERRALREAFELSKEVNRLKDLVQRAHTIIGIREAAHATHKGKAWLNAAARELNNDILTQPLPIYKRLADCERELHKYDTKEESTYWTDYAPGRMKNVTV